MDPTARRRRTVLIAGIAGALILLILVGIGAYGLIRGPHPATPAPAPAPAPAATTTAQQAADVMLHLDGELRAAAQLIMQDVIDDFAPHIETEIKRRLAARMERLLSQYE